MKVHLDQVYPQLIIPLQMDQNKNSRVQTRHFRDGISLTRSSNEINDLFSGYTVNLLSSTTVGGTDTPANLVGSVDTVSATSNLQSFVDAVNTAKKLLNEKTFRGSSTESAGDLSDDPVVKNVKDRLNTILRSVSRIWYNKQIFIKSWYSN